MLYVFIHFKSKEEIQKKSESFCQVENSQPQMAFSF